ncbi:MAG: YlbL family protein [Acidimicrobiales bacterium]
MGTKWRMALAGALVAGLSVVATTVPLPYYAMSPGVTLPVASLVSVPGGRAHVLNGRLLMTTVSIARLRPVQLPLALVNPSIEVLPQREVLGNLPPSQLYRADLAQMSVSKQAAEVVALRRLGYSVPEHGSGSLVVEVVKGSPASKFLSVGDVVVAIGTRATPVAADAVAAIGAHRPGQSVTVSYRAGRTGPVRRHLVRLAPKPHGAGRVAFLGVGLVTAEPTFKLPIGVKINSSNIGGPSAGLAFTLGILDEMTNGDLTAGRTVAATGTISQSGAVGPVGGVAEKTLSVRKAGASVFLVPPQEYHKALRNAGPDLRVVPVASLSQALSALAGLGGHVPRALLEAPAVPSGAPG